MANFLWQDPFHRDMWNMMPPRIFDQHFGEGLLSDDLVTPVQYQGFYVRPRRSYDRQHSGISEVVDTEDRFKLLLDVKHFLPDEIEVRTVGNHVVVHGKHEERADKHGTIAREFTRKYLLPAGVEPETLTSSLGRDGILSIEAPKVPPESPKPTERIVPVVLQPEKQPDSQNFSSALP